MASDDPAVPNRPARQRWRYTVATWAGATLSLTGLVPALVLARTDRLHGWIVLPLVILAYAGVAVGYAAQRRAARDRARPEG